ncbi:uncharacterized protein CLUP02_05244 [Colletotrichum lupini]|uniref:Uncharacterized protein n=1 Tax=Colletotrichum lupini TaxID=145971 RepID=A0A9Q8WDW1_9PEZI|nr:uncharacterized protein CLUP02_05244 [Colletotrichum lupini]UQC79764.1 hypothetical protein CLUP02_05244 [Colletotrichum lupini]
MDPALVRVIPRRPGRSGITGPQVAQMVVTTIGVFPSVLGIMGLGGAALSGPLPGLTIGPRFGWPPAESWKKGGTQLLLIRLCHIKTPHLIHLEASGACRRRKARHHGYHNTNTL